MPEFQGIILTEDDLKRLETRFGHDVRRMGAWNSDGTFGYLKVPLVVVQRAVESFGDPFLDSALARLERKTDQTAPFLEFLATYGPPLIDRIVAAYRECSVELMFGMRPLPKPPEQETRRATRRAAG